MVPTKKASTSEDAEAAAVARQNQLNEQQAQGFLYFFLLRTVCILVAVRSSGILKGKQKLLILTGETMCKATEAYL